MKKRQTYLIAALALVAGALFAQDKSLDLPQAIPDLVDWLLAAKTFSVVKYTAVITLLTQVVKALVAAFGGKLAPKYTPGIVSLVGLLTLVEQSVAKGTVGGADWSAIAVSLIATVAAFFGYKVLFSKEAKVQQDD